MSATFGQKFKITLFGESHAEAIGAVIDGVPAGVRLDTGFIADEMRRRAPGGEAERELLVRLCTRGREGHGTVRCGSAPGGA